MKKIVVEILERLQLFSKKQQWKRSYCQCWSNIFSSFDCCLSAASSHQRPHPPLQTHHGAHPQSLQRSKQVQVSP